MSDILYNPSDNNNNNSFIYKVILLGQSGILKFN